MTLPLLATAAATMAFCSGVTSVSPCPIEASASLSPATFCGKREATARIGSPVESDPSIVIVESKPSFLAMSDTVSSPSATPSCANAVFDEYAMALLSEILPSEPSPSDDEFVSSVCVPGSV